jgi:hypothetical protein
LRFFDFGWRRERGVVAKLMAELRGLVDEGTSDLAVRFQGEADEGGAGRRQEIAALNG